MANPFFSGRIPPGLADKIDAHLLNTGETRSELLVRLLRAEVDDNNSNNSTDNKFDNRLTDVVIRLERLEQLIDDKTDNNKQTDDNKADNVDVPQPSGKDWVNLATIAAQLDVLPKSISGAASKRGRDIGNDTIEFEVAERTIHKKGSGLKALYQLGN
jgi:type I restriction-modification system DNA methylase subunit